MLLLPAATLASNPPFKDQPFPHSFFDRDVLEYNSGTFIESYTGNDSAIPNPASRKSPLLAGVLSAAVPGAGEIYSGHWLRGLAHLGIELTAWGFYFHYDNKGDEQTVRFKNYANQNWDVTKYVRWLNVYWGANISIHPDNGLSPWERVSWQEINAFERTIAQFSHRLEPYDTQQYYELIGKYPQYTRGWQDSDPIGNFEPGENEIEAERDAYFDDISEMFTFYSSKRGYANTLYARAHNAAIVVFLNHFISAFHAAYLAHRFNEAHFAVDIENRRDLYGERFVPTMRLQIEF